MSADVQPIKPGRLLSLDTFRGLTIAAMFLVNNPGDWGHIFPPLDHAEWFGCTATDLIFPFFLFIMGVAMTFSFARRLQEADGRAQLLPQILRRAVILFALGCILTWWAGFAFGRTMKWLGVLQRIGLCYLFASLIALWWKVRGQAIWTIVLLVGYAIWLKWIPVPGGVAGDLSPKGNWVAFLDKAILGEFNAEGVLSTIPAIATTLTGLLCGHWLRDKSRDGNEKVAGMAAAGLLLFVVAALWQYGLPFSKKLWTSSYVVHTTALALWTLAACYWIIDIKQVTGWTKPFVVYGTNAITAYFGVGIMAYGTILVKVPGPDGKPMFLKYWLYENLYKSWVPKVSGILLPDDWGLYVSSAAYATGTYVVLWCALMWILYKKKIFIKV